MPLAVGERGPGAEGGGAAPPTPLGEEGDPGGRGRDAMRVAPPEGVKHPVTRESQAPKAPGRPPYKSALNRAAGRF